LKQGRFITLEGGEGAGKSTQAQRLAAHLRSRGHDVVLTREPGGTPQGEALRDLLVKGDTDQWSAASEAMLMSAAREVHVRTVIAPALQSGRWVVCDRFMDSTRAYQGYAGGASLELVAALEGAAVGRWMPDLTLVFDLAPELGLARTKARGKNDEDRFERKGVAFHARLREAFAAIAAAEPQRCKMIDASADREVAFVQILTALDGLADV
jgi:dTMP kinase